MNWFRTHPYASALGAAALLIAGGMYIVIVKSPTAPANSETQAWGGAGVILNPSYTAGPGDQNTNAAGIMQQVQNNAPYTYIAPPPQPTNADATGATADGFDFNAFITLLSSGKGGTASNGAAGGSGVADAYSFIPGGLVSTSTQTGKRTRLQDSLYMYGNDVGSLIQSFEQAHPNETQVLTDQAQDRANAGKAATVQALGQALSALGDGLLAMDGVPSQMNAAHESLAQSYKDIGQKLVAIPRAERDADFIAAIETYNASVQIFTKNYVALANLFVAYGVKFSQNDAGNVFTFTNSSF